MAKLNDIIARVRSYHPAADFDLIKRAYVYSTNMHGGQVRKSGEPYVTHPLEVAYILAELKMDEATVCTGLLHDTVEDTLATLEEVEKLFGKDIAALVDGVTKLSAIEFSSQEEKQAENFRKMLVAMAKDIRVILVKLADRLHNMRTLEHMKPEKQERIAQETQEIYAPLANRLGISWMKLELEDLSFKYTHPREFQEISDQLGQTKKEREKFIDDVVQVIKNKLKGTSLENADVTGRPKHLYSIYKKMRDKQVSVDGLHDIIAFRILCDDVTQCYEGLGHIHTLWRPVPGRFKDYIAMPKPNMYQSLHTGLVGPGGQRVEVQIRTRDMHAVAEEGIAAHWQYKERGGTMGQTDKDDRKFAWLRQLMEWQKELKDPTEFMESVKVDLFQDEVYVFTPNGRVVELPRGSTPVDFAYAIHSEVGNKCSGAKVNGRIVPLKAQLKNGDTCEILTKPDQRPNKDWLQFVKTGRARNRIRALIREAERERSAEIGRELVDKEFKRLGASFSKLEKNGEFEKAFSEGKHKTTHDILIAVGYGKLSPHQVAEKVLGEDAVKKAQDAAAEAKPESTTSRLGNILARVARRTSTQSSGITIEGMDEMLIRYGKCCAPVQGDPVVGFVTRGRGLTIHTKDCPHATQLDPERRVEVSWNNKVKLSRPVTLRIVTDDREGMLADLSQVFTKSGVNISVAHCRALEDGGAVNSFKVGIVDLEQLRKVVKALEGVKGVHRVDRARGRDELEA